MYAIPRLWQTAGVGHAHVRRAARPLDHVLTLLVVLVPFGVAVFRAAAHPQWRADLTSLRDLGLVSVGFGGALSSAAVQTSLWLPLGSHWFRASLAAALALALASWALARVAKRVLYDVDTPAWLISVLAAVAAVTAALSPTWQAEATVAGGAMLAVAPTLLAFDVALASTTTGTASLTPGATTRWLLVACLVGLVLAESLACAFALICAIGMTLATAGRMPPRRSWLVLGAVSTCTLALLSVPMWLRPLSSGGWSDVRHMLSAASLRALDVAVVRDGALSAWVQEVGVVSLALALVGTTVALFQQERRAALGGFVVFVLLDMLYPVSATSRLVADPLAALRALALSAFAVWGAVGILEVVTFAYKVRLPMARTVAVLVVVFHLTVVAVASDEAGHVADRSGHAAAEAWTDAGLDPLPRRAAVLVHSPDIAWRLWAAQTLEGARPDVLVVPVPLLQHGWAPLLRAEPAVEQLLADLALTGQSSELALAQLAEARPLYTELDARWDSRMVTHLSVEGAWLRFEPQVHGRSDRTPARAHSLDADGRVASLITSGQVPDHPSTDVVVRTLREHVTALSLAGAGRDTGGMLVSLERIDPRDPFVVGARLRLAHAERIHKGHRGVDLRDLLRF